MENFLEKQSARIANTYGLIPSYVTQDNMMEYLSENPDKNYVRVDPAINKVARDSKESKLSTMAISSYMNPFTPNKRLAILHSVGTGKTRKSLLAALSYNRDITIVAVHSVQLDPFVKELANSNEIRKLYPGFRKRMEAITCKGVAKAMQDRDYDLLDYYFKDRVIIIDEAHHIKNDAEKIRTNRDSPLFDSVVRILEMYKDNIAFFLTATLLVDTASEIFGVYNLLKGEHPSCRYNPQNIAELLTGYVSELTQNNLRHKDVIVKCLMEKHGKQWELYKRHKHDKSSVHSKTRAVSRFITEDDDRASEYKKSMKEILDEKFQGIQFKHIDEYHQQCIEELRFISIKMYAIVKIIQENPNEPVLIYDAWKERGGVDRLIDVLAMPAVGFSLVMSEQDARDENKPRKMLALHKLPQRKGALNSVSRLIDIFNSEENRQGKLIQLLIITPKYAESMSIVNAFTCIIVQPMWNETTAAQIFGRCNRKTSLSYLSNDDPRKQIKNITCVLYKPNGKETMESDIIKIAKLKHKGIVSTLKILSENKIDSLLNSKPPISCSFQPRITFCNSRINHAVRFCSDKVHYRNLPIEVEPFFVLLEECDSLFGAISNIMKSGSGYSRLLNMVIKSLESLYVKKLQNKQLTSKQGQALEDVSKTFITLSGTRYHVMYMCNHDTTEYQELAPTYMRVARALNESTWEWTDNDDPDIVNKTLEIYQETLKKFARSISENWSRYEFYAVRYIFSSCYKLVRHRDEQELVRQSSARVTDKRKESRGEKWSYYSKDVLINLLFKLYGKDAVGKESMIRKSNRLAIFQAILPKLIDLNMVLEVPF